MELSEFLELINSGQFPTLAEGNEEVTASEQSASAPLDDACLPKPWMDVAALLECGDLGGATRALKLLGSLQANREEKLLANLLRLFLYTSMFMQDRALRPAQRDRMWALRVSIMESATDLLPAEICLRLVDGTNALQRQL